MIWAAPLAGLFLIVDVPFFAANISKIYYGAWFPLVIGATFFTLMLTWAKGRKILAAKLHKVIPQVHQFIVDLAVVAHYGFMEGPRLDTLFSLVRAHGLNLGLEKTGFYIGHENLVVAEPSAMRVGVRPFLFLCPATQPMPPCFLIFQRTKRLKSVFDWKFDTPSYD